MRTLEKAVKIIRNYAIFAVGGLSVFIFNLFLTILLTEHLKIKYYYSFAIALFIGIFLLYFYHFYITFSKSRKGNFGLFFLAYSFSSALFWTSSTLMTKLLKTHYLLGIIIFIIPISLLNFST